MTSHNMEGVQQTTNLCDLLWSIFSNISQPLDRGSAWRKVVETADSYPDFILRDYEIEECALEVYRNRSPSVILLRKWGNKGMTVADLSELLDKTRMEAPLLYIKEHETLRLSLYPDERVTVTEGDPLILPCLATGFPYPVYCWFKDIEQLTSHKEGDYHLRHASLEDSGRYICRIHHDFKGTKQLQWTNWCEVVVKKRPQAPCLPVIVIQPEPHITCAMLSSTKIQCHATGVPCPSYQWMRDNIDIENATESEYLIQFATPTDAGEYVCRVFNGCGDVYTNLSCIRIGSAYTICLPDIPVILEQPTDKIDAIGGRVIFAVRAQCKRKLKYQWYHDNQQIEGAAESEYQFQIKSRSEEGKYQCRVYNNTHSSMSRLATLDVNANLKQYLATDKIALVIGTAIYTSNCKPLKNLDNDVVKMSNALEKLNFKVISLMNLTLAEMKTYIDLFCNMISDINKDVDEPNGVYGFVYFAGHGYSYEGNNYIVPMDAKEGLRVDCCLCMQDLEMQVQNKNPKLCVIFTDCCRKDSFHQVKSGQSDKSDMSTSPKYSGNLIVYYGTSYGQQAYQDDLGGFFTRIYLDVIQSRVSVFNMWEKINKGFSQINLDEQTPELKINLKEIDRSLQDPIDFSVVSIEREKRRILYERIEGLPPAFTIEVGSSGIKLLVNFVKYCSNILDMYILEMYKDSGYEIFDICVRGLEHTPILWESIVEPKSNDLVNQGPIIKILRFPNLQKLKGNLHPTLVIMLDVMCPESGLTCRRQLLVSRNLGEPLTGILQSSGESHARMPGEQEDLTTDDSMHTSLSSSLDYVSQQ